MNMQAVDRETLEFPPYDWRKFSFVWLVHVLSLIGVVLWALDFFAMTWRSGLLALVWFVMGSTTITAGYHRLFAHATYKASWLLKLYYALTGGSCFQGSVLQWSAQHRDHHTFVDQPRDPYNIHMGFWFAHMGWVMRQTNPNYNRVRDLQKDPLLRWQLKYYYPLALAMCFVVPTLLGALWQEALGAFVATGLLRLVIQWHMTFCVNSVAHYWGSQKYSTKHSARGSWWLSFLTWGEMDHNYHHTFPNDFRTGTHWWDFDPGKWWIKCCQFVGLASDLRQVDADKIQRAIERTAAHS